MLIHALLDNKLTIDQGLKYEVYDGNYNGDINSGFFNEPYLTTGTTTDLSTISTITNNYLNENDTNSRSIIVNGFFRARETGTYTFGVAAESLNNPTYEGTGLYPQSAPIDETNALSIGNDSLFIYNFKLERSSVGVITEIGGSANGTCITIYDNGNTKTLQIYHFKSSSPDMDIEELIDIDRFVGQDIQLVLYLIRDDITGFWNVKVIINNELVDDYNINFDTFLAGNNFTSVGGIDPDTTTLPLNFFKTTNNYSSPFYSHKLWYATLPTNTNVKANLVFNNTTIIDINNGTYDFLPVTATVNLNAGSYYSFNLYLGKSNPAYFSAYFTEPNSTTRTFNGSGLDVFYLTNYSPGGGETNITSLVYNNDSLYGRYKIGLIGLYVERGNFATTKDKLLFISSPQLYIPCSGSQLLVLHEEPVSNDFSRKDHHIFSDEFELDAELNGKIELKFQRRNNQGVLSNVSFQRAVLVMQASRLDKLDRLQPE